jgi:hypothetical protein
LPCVPVGKPFRRFKAQRPRVDIPPLHLFCVSTVVHKSRARHGCERRTWQKGQDLAARVRAEERPRAPGTLGVQSKLSQEIDLHACYAAIRHVEVMNVVLATAKATGSGKRSIFACVLSRNADCTSSCTAERWLFAPSSKSVIASTLARISNGSTCDLVTTPPAGLISTRLRRIFDPEAAALLLHNVFECKHLLTRHNVNMDVMHGPAPSCT